MAETSFVESLKTGNEIEKKIYSERLLLMTSVEEGLRKSLEGDVAFLWVTNLVDEHVGQNCSHIKIPQCLYTYMGGWPVRKDFAYTGFINY